MAPARAPREQLDALEEERAFADLSDFRKVRVTGSDARTWLSDLVTCDVASLAPGQMHRSLLLTPTGRIRADFGVAMDEDGFLLLQPADQPDHVGLLLSRYVLSSDVLLHDSTSELTLFAVPGAAAARLGLPGLAPSVLGSGVDLVAAAGTPAWRVENALVKHDLVEVGPDALEVWRIRRGASRMGPDFDQDALPAEVGLDSTIDATKGCFLGQESVAKVRDRGHPPRLLKHVRCAATLEPGDIVTSEGQEVGRIKSAAVTTGGDVLGFAMVRWSARDRPLRAGGHELIGSLD